VKSGQNRGYDQFTSIARRATLYMRLCLQHLKEIGDDTMEDLCTATLPVGVGFGYAADVLETPSVARSSADSGDSDSSKQSAPKAKKPRGNVSKDKVGAAADAIKSLVEGRQTSRVMFETAQTVSTLMATLTQLMVQRRGAENDSERERFDKMIDNIEKRLEKVD
jgi:hypothetical protein